MGGVVQVLFGEMALTISLALLASLFTALMLVPMLSSKFLRLEFELKKNILGKFYRRSEKWFSHLEDIYGKSLSWALSHRKVVILGSVLLLVVTFGGLKAGLVGTEFMPEMDQDRFKVNIELPTGTRYEETGEVLQEISGIMVKEIPELKDSFIRWGVGEMGIGTLLGGKEASNTGMASENGLPLSYLNRDIMLSTSSLLRTTLVTNLSYNSF